MGTAYTVAVSRRPDGQIQPLLFDGTPLLPSAVYAEGPNRLLAGWEAFSQAASDPSRLELHPLRHIDTETLTLGGHPVGIEAALKVVLQRVALEADRAGSGTPGRDRVTTVVCPAAWSPPRRLRLADAAAAAGLGQVSLTPTPVAAATYYTMVLGRSIPVGSALAVYDFGAGRFEASVVRRDPQQFEILATESVDGVGGLDIDNAIVTHLGTVHGAVRPADWKRLTSPSTPEDWQHRLALWNSVRAAKESLLTTPTASIHLPLFGTDALLTREDLDRLAGPIVQRTVEAMVQALYRSRITPQQLAGVFLVGGSSRLPLVGAMLHQALATVPVPADQPELAVAVGAATPLPPSDTQEPPTLPNIAAEFSTPATPAVLVANSPSAPPTAPVSPPVPVAGPPAPPQGGPSVPAPVPGPGATPPMPPGTQPPVGAMAHGSGTTPGVPPSAPTSGAPPAYPPSSGPTSPPPGPPPGPTFGPYPPLSSGPPPRRNRSALIGVLAGVIVLILLVGTGVVYFLTRPSDDDNSTTTSPGPGEERAVITNIAEPHSLLPSQASTRSELAIVHSLYTGLVTLNPEDGSPTNTVAEAVDSADNRVWTIRIREGWTFHNGDPVDAEAFARAWNYAAYGPNQQANNHFFARIEGYDQMQGDNPSANQLSGVEVVDARTLQVTLTTPFVGFRRLLAEAAFLPVTAGCLEDLETCHRHPIGNGPFRVASALEEGNQIVLERNEDYPGEQPQIDVLTLRIMPDPETAYMSFVAGDLTLVDGVPSSSLDNASQEYGEHLTNAFDGQILMLALPLYRPEFSDPEVRRALSLALDREAIAGQVAGEWQALNNFIPSGTPAAPGEGNCGYCQTEPARAAQLLDQAGGWSGDDALELWYDDPRLEPLAGEIREQLVEVLEIEVELREVETAELVERTVAQELPGMALLRWRADYPRVDGYIGPLFRSDGAYNYWGFNDADFDRLMREADSQPDPQTQYRDALEVLDQQMPAIPVAAGVTTIVSNGSIEGITVDAGGRLRYDTLSFAE